MDRYTDQLKYWSTNFRKQNARDEYSEVIRNATNVEQVARTTNEGGESCLYMMGVNLYEGLAFVHSLPDLPNDIFPIFPSY